MNESYENAINQVRNLPQSTPVETEAKHHEAKLLRMQFQMDNAACMIECNHALTINPYLAAAELTHDLENSDLLIQTKTAQTYVEKLLENRDMAAKGLNDLDLSAGVFKRSPEQLLYKYLQKLPGTYETQGKLSLDLSFPLALGLVIEKRSDFDKIDPRKNVGGFYTKYLDCLDMTLDKVPVFVICQSTIDSNPDNTDEIRLDPKIVNKIQIHEQGHAQNEVVVKTLRNLDPSFALLTDQAELLDQPERERLVSNLRNIYLANPEDYKNSPEWKMILGTSLGRAQDELLADINYSEGEPAGSLTNKQADLLDREGIYNYFINDWDLTKNDPLYKELWNTYEETIRKAVNTADRIMQNYDYFDLTKRGAIFAGVLAQIPVTAWDYQLSETLYLEEAKAMEGILFAKVKLVFNPDPIKAKLIEEFKEKCQNSQEKPFFGLIAEYQKRLGIK